MVLIDFKSPKHVELLQAHPTAIEHVTLELQLSKATDHLAIKFAGPKFTELLNLIKTRLRIALNITENFEQCVSFVPRLRRVLPDAPCSGSSRAYRTQCTRMLGRT